jgi:hypothetical protein
MVQYVLDPPTPKCMVTSKVGMGVKVRIHLKAGAGYILPVLR